MHAVEWQREKPPRPPLPLLTATDHQYHRKAEKPRLAYRWCWLSIIFIAAVSTAAGGSFDLLSHHGHRLCRVLGIHTQTCHYCVWFQHTMPLATNDPSPVAYFIHDHECEYREMLTSLRAHMLISWGWFLGTQEINAWYDHGTNCGRALLCDFNPFMWLLYPFNQRKVATGQVWSTNPPLLEVGFYKIASKHLSVGSNNQLWCMAMNI